MRLWREREVSLLLHRSHNPFSVFTTLHNVHSVHARTAVPVFFIFFYFNLPRFSWGSVLNINSESVYRNLNEYRLKSTNLFAEAVVGWNGASAPVSPSWSILSTFSTCPSSFAAGPGLSHRLPSPPAATPFHANLFRCLLVFLPICLVEHLLK